MSNGTLVKFRILLYTFWALFNSWGTSMSGVKWASMSWEEQSCLIVGIGGSWIGMMMAYFDKSAWRLDQENLNGIDKKNNQNKDIT